MSSIFNSFLLSENIRYLGSKPIIWYREILLSSPSDSNKKQFLKFSCIFLNNSKKLYSSPILIYLGFPLILNLSGSFLLLVIFYDLILKY